MKFEKTKLPGVVVITPKINGDARGYFAETFRHDLLENYLGYEICFVQDNESKSSFGVLRGLHYQLPPFTQTKLVRVIKGRVLDIAVDIRKGASSFGEWVAVELSETNMKQLFVPRGFAHGFVVLSEEVIFSYKVDNYYSPECDRGIKYNDSTLNIDWLIDEDKLSLSQKDIILPAFSDAEYFNYNENYYAK